MMDQVWENARRATDRRVYCQALGSSWRCAERVNRRNRRRAVMTNSGRSQLHTHAQLGISHRCLMTTMIAELVCVIPLERRAERRIFAYP